VRAWRTTQRRHAQSRILGQRQELARLTICFGFEDRVLRERRAGFFDVEVDAGVGQAEQIQRQVAQKCLPFAQFASAGRRHQ